MCNIEWYYTDFLARVQGRSVKRFCGGMHRLLLQSVRLCNRWTLWFAWLYCYLSRPCCDCGDIPYWKCSMFQKQTDHHNLLVSSQLKEDLNDVTPQDYKKMTFTFLLCLHLLIVTFTKIKQNLKPIIKVRYLCEVTASQQLTCTLSEIIFVVILRNLLGMQYT